MTSEGSPRGEQKGRNVPGKLTMMYVRFGAWVEGCLNLRRPKTGLGWLRTCTGHNRYDGPQIGVNKHERGGALLPKYFSLASKLTSTQLKS